MSDDWKDFEIGADIDVTEIMNRIRERIAQKQREGVYSEESIAELADAKILQFAEEADIDSVLLDRLRSPDHSWNINPSYIITSHRSGWKANLVILTKKLVRPVIKLYTDHIVGRQAQINLYFAHLIHNLVREITRLQIDFSGTKHQLERIEREKAYLEQRLKTLESMVQFKDEEPRRTE